MNALVVIQARTGSTRLPGKVLQPVGGRPMLRYQLDRLRAGTDLPVVIATSTLDRDDAVAELASDAGVECVRGSESDVLARFGAVLDAYEPETLVRLTGDCPLIDPVLMLQVVAVHEARGDDYTSNVFPRTFPCGLDVEVVAASALRVAISEARDPDEREHVMPFIYRRPARFRLGNVESDMDLGHGRWVVDTADDLRVVREIVDHFMPRVDFGWLEILDAFPVPAPASLGITLRRATGADAPVLLALRNDEDAVRHSGTGRPVHAEEHLAWLEPRLASPATRLWMVCADDSAVGQLRLEVDEGLGTVSIGVDRAHRGQAVAHRALRCLQDGLVGDMQVVGLRARVHPENAASRSVFERAGFVTVGEHDGFVEYEWLQVAGSDGREKP